MTPKEKAIELVNLFTIGGFQQRNDGIQCALIAVDEIDKSQPYHLYNNEDKKQYWLAVKQEIEKL